MKNLWGYLPILYLLFLVSCAQPNYHYRVDAPAGWTMYDTAVQGLKVRILKPPESTANEGPLVNIIISFMEHRDLDAFTGRNIDYLEQNMGGIRVQEKGEMDVTGIRARWFTYTKVQNGLKRDMINYIIPSRGFAYMITCGVNAGFGVKYRLTFDNTARSFKG